MNEKEECQIYEDIIKRANTNINNKVASIDSNKNDLQLLNVISGSGNPPVVTYNQTVIYGSTEVLEVYYTLEANRIGVGDYVNVWETLQRITTSPYNSNYGAQTKNVHMYINDLGDDDEWLEKYLPDSTVNNNNSSTSVGFGFSQNGSSVNASVTQGMSYSDVQVAADFYRMAGTVDWNFGFQENSNVAKHSYTMEPKTIMTNKIAGFYFEHGGEVNFTLTTGFLWTRVTYTYELLKSD